MLKNGMPSQSRMAMRILGQIGPPAKVAVPELKKALDAPDPETRKAAKCAIDQITGAAKP